ncbi:MAG: hypothetical protein KGL15_03990 [Acidobacteriota bacterium]|nr:hypothetical protein [Acidobacteriota bacterium]
MNSSIVASSPPSRPNATWIGVGVELTLIGEPGAAVSAPPRANQEQEAVPEVVPAFTTSLPGLNATGGKDRGFPSVC